MKNQSGFLGTVGGFFKDAFGQPHSADDHVQKEIGQSIPLHSILKYDEYDSKTGLFYNENSVSFCFEVIPQTGADEDMVTRLKSLFTPIPANYGIQWTMFGNPINDDNYFRYVELREMARDRDLTVPFYIDLAKKQVKHARKNSGKPFFADRNFSLKRPRLVFSISKDCKLSDRRTINEVHELIETLFSSIKTAKLFPIKMDAQALKKFLYPYLNPHVMFQKEPMPALQYDEGRSLKHQLTSLSQSVRLTANEIIFDAPTEEHEDIYARTFSVAQYPRRKNLWEMANIIGSQFDDNSQYPCPYLITSGIFTLDKNSSETSAKLKQARAKQNANSKMVNFQPELVEISKDWDAVVYQMGQGTSLCEIYHTVVLFAPEKLINRASQVALNIWSDERFTIEPRTFLHLATYYASLPMTLTAALREDLKKIRLMSTKTTINAIDMSPVIGEWFGAGDPAILNFGRRGSPIMWDVFSNKQGNYNVFATGVSGAGKSVFLSHILSSYRGVGARVWVIDIGRSYTNLAALENGTIVQFTPNSDIGINPFSWAGVETFKDDLKFLTSIVCTMASPNEELSAFRVTLIVEAITLTWDEMGADSDITRVAHHLGQIKDEGGVSVDRHAFELSKQLQRYCRGGMYGHLFDGAATLTLDGDMIVLELEELKDSPDLRKVVLQTVTSKILYDMYRSRDRKKVFLLDEAWQLLGDNDTEADFIEEGYRRARKYGGSFMIGTQSIGDALQNKASKAAFNNADWKIYFRQDPESLENILNSGAITFSDVKKRMILSLTTQHGFFSEALLSSPNGDVIVRHIPDPFSLVMSATNAADFNEFEALSKQGYTVMEALTIMLERKGIYEHE